MRHLVIFLFLMFLFFTETSAQEKSNHTLATQKLIAQIKSSPPSKRRVLMNKLKLELRKMNQETREKVMMDLKKSFTKNGTSKPIHSSGAIDRGRTNLQQRSSHRPGRNQQPGGRR